MFKIKFILFLILSLFISCSKKQYSENPPNFIVIFTDDQGYGDLSCFGAKHVKTPFIDQLAVEGVKLTSFYVAASVCTPSRAALLTGSYPKRVDMSSGGIYNEENNKPFVVTLAADPKGLNPNEITIAEVLKRKNYVTGIFGKWHLGDQLNFLPTRQGFDEFFGIPYSHDIHTFHPNRGNSEMWNFPPLPLLDGEKVIELDPDADNLTKRITEKALDFIQRNRERPFFLYIPHPLPHNPLHVSSKYMENVSDSLKTILGKEENSINYTARNELYPQAISEIDDSVGEIINLLKDLDLERKTLIIFTTDNGPGTRLASAGPLRGRKGSTFEGGMRVPAIAWWPGTIPAGKTSDALSTTMDLLPTLAGLAKADIPNDRVIDGKDIWNILSGKEDEKSPHKNFFYFFNGRLEAVRSGPWKYREINNKAQLFNLDKDIGERNNVLLENPIIVKKMKKYMVEMEDELGKGSILGKGVRKAGWITNPTPLNFELNN